MNKQLKELKKMLTDAHDQVRKHRGKTWPRFGLEVYLLGVILKVNGLLALEKNQKLPGFPKS